MALVLRTFEGATFSLIDFQILDEYVDCRYFHSSLPGNLKSWLTVALRLYVFVQT